MNGGRIRNHADEVFIGTTRSSITIKTYDFHRGQVTIKKEDIPWVIAQLERMTDGGLREVSYLEKLCSGNMDDGKIGKI